MKMTDATQLIESSRAVARGALAGPGDWLSGEERLDVWREARDSRTNSLDRERKAALTPAMVAGAHGPSRHLSATAVDVVHRIASDPGRLSRNWASAAMSELGEEIYTELVAVTGTAVALDSFDRAMGDELAPLPAVVSGDPSRIRPDSVGEVGAWVSQTTGEVRANVSRAVSLVPVSDAAWRQLVNAHYSRGNEFYDMNWSRALNRPQTELVASRVTALLECFY